MGERLKGKTALVTGGGTGIGLAIATALAREGCRVAIAGRRESALTQAAKAYKGQPPLATHAVDVGDLASVERLFAWGRSELGPLDILVNSAGINVVHRSMAELSPADWDAMLRINASGAYYCARAALPAMRERRDGLIVNISSIAGKRGSLLGGVGYTASKFAMTGLGSTLALEEGANGIRVTNVYPGEVDTPILEHRPTPVSQEHRDRILQPEDVAEAVLMVACLPPRAHVSELIIKPTSQPYA
jgi:NAD(P)-dependent dehydrogenase (short-subunit alcohol dehydrogenase family)